MEIFKIIILMGIVGSSSYIGILKSKTFENRVRNLIKISEALNIFKTKIEFTYEPIKEIFEEISNVIYQNKENVFKNTIENIKEKSVSSCWIEATEKSKEDFTKEDIEVLKTLGKLLGKTDKSGQVSQIELTEKLLEKQIEKAETDKNKNTKLYKTLGTVLGLGICILLI